MKDMITLNEDITNSLSKPTRTKI